MKIETIGDDGPHVQSERRGEAGSDGFRIQRTVGDRKNPAVMTDDEIDEELKRVQLRNSRLVAVEDRAAEKDDVAVIDFEGFVDGQAFQGGKGESYSLTLARGSSFRALKIR